MYRESKRNEVIRKFNKEREKEREVSSSKKNINKVPTKAKKKNKSRVLKDLEDISVFNYFFK